ncbi:hypothetical protein [Duganella guangzhouensis]|nr:hypothetical protein [Duganella guangzhouensis]
MRTLLTVFRNGSPRGAILSAFGLCGLYFASWYIISHFLSTGLIAF